jgi:hypothetical protein
MILKDWPRGMFKSVLISSYFSGKIFLTTWNIFSFSYLQEFMLCRRELKDPRKCISEGKAVTSCALDFFRNVKKTCSKEFTQYANCLDKSSTKLEFEQ